jgi:hypothetical protein
LTIFQWKPISTSFSITAAVSPELGLIFAHEVDTGVQFYALKTFHQMQARYFKAETPGVSIPVGFAPGSPFAILGSQGKGIFQVHMALIFHHDYPRQNTAN